MGWVTGGRARWGRQVREAGRGGRESGVVTVVAVGTGGAS